MSPPDGRALWHALGKVFGSGAPIEAVRTPASDQSSSMVMPAARRLESAPIESFSSRITRTSSRRAR
jgi:hypothetical protein